MKSFIKGDEHKVKENKSFKVRFNGELYDCLIQTKDYLDGTRVACANAYTFYISKLKELKKTRKFFGLTLRKYKTLWNHTFRIQTSVLVEPFIKHYIVDESKWFDVDELKKWIEIGIKEKEVALALSGKLKHANIVVLD